ncbi:MAG: molybdopterin-guanine dinucleotide biosynthesis protein B [Undibacterium sp.]|uniref:molybdopterin-guanine dinucleotide biosynthesis protein B n=1 Tax=Undibacterium sp. TaxID=1914977 RepID=UPI002720D017|nr:molybdopterin-guanine dinucleotide biosynthesis protein B [Undibacterium sp.]MDO8652247.1 molybdopterin-guanine dinucleotide biosynthesis protein B [Undibacterium sp.]
MRVFGIAGHSGMGKTTLLERILPELQARGLTVSLIKHSHKDLDIDHPGKDSYRLREAGCAELLLIGRRRWALMHELNEDAEPSLSYLLSRLQTCDLVLIEGFKQGDFPKLEVWRAAVGKTPLWPDWPGIAAIATDSNVAIPGMSALALSDISGIADFICQHAAEGADIPSVEAPYPREQLFLA